MSRLEPLSALDSADLAGLPRVQVWDCFNRAQMLTATFEAHEAAMRNCLMPDEATTLSLVLAELSLRAMTRAKGAVVSVFIAADGWRVEAAVVPGPPGVVSWGLGESALLRSLTSVDAREVEGAGLVLVAEQRRPANA